MPDNKDMEEAMRLAEEALQMAMAAYKIAWEKLNKPH